VTLTILILGALGALGFGIWLGTGGSYRPDFDEIEEALEEPGRKRKKTKKHFTFLNAYMNRKPAPDASRRRSTRTPFGRLGK